MAQAIRRELGNPQKGVPSNPGPVVTAALATPRPPCPGAFRAVPCGNPTASTRVASAMMDTFHDPPSPSSLVLLLAPFHNMELVLSFSPHVFVLEALEATSGMFTCAPPWLGTVTRKTR